MNPVITIGNKKIGEDYPPYFIADVGANHDGQIERAYKLIELAKEAGADAAKFQNFQADKIVSKHGFESLGNQMAHQAKWKKSVYETYQDASISFDWTMKLKEKCDEVGIDYFTSPYDFESVDHVDPFVDVYKIGSGDITWLEIIEYIAQKGKPVLIATGASDMADVDRAMQALSRYTNDICLMQCNTNYTLDKDKIKYVNLNVLKTFRSRFPGAVLGLSDHTLGHATVVGAVALGARVIEKHFTDDNDREGPDHKFAMNPTTWRDMVDNSMDVFYAMGDGEKRIEENEKQSAIVQRRGLYINKDMQGGTVISAADIVALRPMHADGVEPYKMQELLGKKISKDVRAGEHIKLADF